MEKKLNFFKRKDFMQQLCAYFFVDELKIMERWKEVSTNKRNLLFIW